jgi:Predicted membrane protein (DUF2207) C-terminal domain
MLLIISVATSAGWLLALLAGMSAARSPRPRAGRPGRAGRAAAGGYRVTTGIDEPPAVVSLLAGNLDAYGYPATLLDLAARGWLRLAGPEAGPAGTGPVMCVIVGSPPRDRLTDYEQRVYQQVLSRAAGRGDVPARALSDGFAGSASENLKSAEDRFMDAFTSEVKDDARRRGMSRQRLSEGVGCLLWLAAAVPAVSFGLALHARHSHFVWVAAAGFVALCCVAGVAVKGERPTPAGRAVLDRWLASVDGRRAMAPAMSPGWPDRQVAYAAALGRDRAAARLFSGQRGRPPGRKMWSSYGGSWREVTIGDSGSCLGSLGMIVTLVLWALVPATIAGVVLSSGTLKLELLLVLAVDVLLALIALSRYQSKPGPTEFDGLVLEAWTKTVSDEISSTEVPYLAIDDGARDRAWVFAVSRQQYAVGIPGTVVHARVDPRRDALLDIRPLLAEAPD